MAGDELTVPGAVAAAQQGGGNALRLSQISKTFGVTRVLSDLNLEIEAGSVHALLGENGSGKSTLIKIVAGYHVPDRGGALEIGGITIPHGSPSAARGAGARFVHQDLGLAEDETVLDSLCVELGYPTRMGFIQRKASERHAAAALRLVGVEISLRALISELSPAERTAVAIARAIEGINERSAKLLVLDEPTATLPEHEVNELLDIIRTAAGHGIGVLYVTHRLDEVFRICDTATVLRDGRHIITTDVSSISRIELVDHIVGHEVETAPTPASDSCQRGAVLVADRLHSSELNGVTVSVSAGEIVGVTGLVGSGYEDVCATIFGARSADAGSITVGGVPVAAGRPRRSIEAGLAYLPADRRNDSAFLDLTARENLTITDLRPLRKRIGLSRSSERRETERWFAELDVRPTDGIEAPLATFSGGNQQKIMFGKWLRRGPKVMLLDEPTQGVDIGAKAALHRQLAHAAKAGLAIVVGSSDVDELVAICHRVLVLHDGRITHELTGSHLTAGNISRASLSL